MDYKQVKELLNRYYSGECTDNEERILQYYFVTGNVPEEFKADQELFRVLHEEKSSAPSDISFDELIEEAIKKDPFYIRPRRISFYKSSILKIAAGFTIIAFSASILFFSLYHSRNSTLSADTFSDPKLAYAEAKKALQFVSVNLNHGTEKLQKLETFNTGLDRMNTLSIINLLQRN
jgi:hypothetical protein